MDVVSLFSNRPFHYELDHEENSIKMKYDEPIISPSLLKKIKNAALIMGFLISCFGRGMIEPQSKDKNIQFQLAVKRNIEDVKDRLSDGAHVNKLGGGAHRKLLSEEDEALLKGSNFGQEGIPSAHRIALQL